MPDRMHARAPTPSARGWIRSALLRRAGAFLDSGKMEFGTGVGPAWETGCPGRTRSHSGACGWASQAYSARARTVSLKSDHGMAGQISVWALP